MTTLTRFVLTALAAVTLSAAGHAQGFNMGMPMPKLGVLMQPDVKKELKITKDQEKKLKEITQKMSANPGTPSPGAPGSGMFGGIDKDLPELLTPDQMKRLNELWIQHEGAFVLNLEEISKPLEITDDQKSKISEAVAAYNDKLMEAMQRGIRSKGDVNKIKAFQAEAEKAILAVLTEAQSKKFTEMQGKKFKFKM